MADKTAVVLGGTHDHISLINELKERGYRTVLIDYLENPPAREYADEHLIESILDVDVIEDIARERNAELVVSACIDRAVYPMAKVSNSRRLPCYISESQAKELSNKFYLKDVMLANEIKTAKYDIIGISQFLFDPSKYKNTKKLHFPLVVKPPDSNSSKGVRKVTTPSELIEAIKFAQGFTNSDRLIIEEFIEGIEISVDAFVGNWRGTIGKRPTIQMISEIKKSKELPDSFTIVENSYPVDLHGKSGQNVRNYIQQLIQKIVDRFDLPAGPLLCQMILHPEKGPHVVEFACRFGGGSKIHLINAVKAYSPIRVFLNNLLNTHYSVEPQKNKVPKCAAIHYVYCKRGKIVEFKGLKEAKEQGLIDDYFIYKPVGCKIEGFLSSSDRPVGLLISGKDQIELKEKLVEAKARIQVIGTNGGNLIVH